ncbi:ACT domain-containing protein [Fructobacillus sp. S1-1]|uniref:UPF0237 protein G6R30_03125 n=2 Tax=Fructobacillus parabroussonetiae TaxID=2713174 RepID=A0ABS5QYJ8_9LACO|nr:ACT domain-containing protein [Fructobacillus parabroussonetiae]
MMKAVVTVVGQDKTGIVAGIATELAAHEVNILDLSQTIMSSTFTMSMLVAISGEDSFNEIHAALKEKGASMGVSVHVQREEIFDTMAHV